jgi:hypothetical protein
LALSYSLKASNARNTAARYQPNFARPHNHPRHLYKITSRSSTTANSRDWCFSLPPSGNCSTYLSSRAQYPYGLNNTPITSLNITTLPDITTLRKPKTEMPTLISAPPTATDLSHGTLEHYSAHSQSIFYEDIHYAPLQHGKSSAIKARWDTSKV